MNRTSRHALCQEEPRPAKVTKQQQLSSKAALSEDGAKGRGKGKSKGRGRGQKNTNVDPEPKTSKRAKKYPTKEVDRVGGYTLEEWEEWWQGQVQEANEEKQRQDEQSKKRKKTKVEPASEPSAPSNPSKSSKKLKDEENRSQDKEKKETKKSKDASKPKESKSKDSKKPKEPKEPKEPEEPEEPEDPKERKKRAKRRRKESTLLPAPATSKEIKAEVFAFLMQTKDFTDDNAKEKLQEIMPNYTNCGLDCRLDIYWKRKEVLGIGVGVFSKKEKNVGFFGFRFLTDYWIYAIAAAIKAGDILATLMHTIR